MLGHLPDTGVNAVKVDGAGNLYIAGFRGALGTPDSYDGFVAKLSPDGSKVLDSVTFAGSKSDFVSALVIDSTGAAYVFGETQSPDFPVTPGSLQPALQANTQAFVAKVDAQGRVVYATLIGGNANIGPTGGGLVVDAAGEVFVSGETSGAGFPATTGAPFTSTDSATFFVMKLDASGSKLLAAVRGLGGRIASDAQGNIYLAGTVQSLPTAIPTTPGAFQTTFQWNPCSGTGQLAWACFYQYLVKLSSALTQIIYATFLSGSYGATPVAISVDAQGNAMVAGTTNSPDYPTTSNGFEPLYMAHAPPGPQVDIFGTIFPPPSSGYVTRLNSTGTALLYSTFYSGTQADAITFAAFTSVGMWLSGQAESPDLPGLDGVPLQCLPENFETRLSADGTSVTAARMVGGSVLAYDSTTQTLVAWTGTDLIRFDPAAPPNEIACIPDAADLQQVTSIAPGELLALFGPHFANGTVSQPAPFPKSIGGLSVNFNGISGPLLYVSPQQINVQVPFEIQGNPSATLMLNLPQVSGVADSRVLPVVTANPAAFLDTATSLVSVDTRHCSLSGSVYGGGPLPIAFNMDGSRNTCSNPASSGSTVKIFLQSLGVTGQAVTGGINPNPGEPLDLPITATGLGGAPIVTVVSASALPGSISGIWQVDLRITSGDKGAIPLSLAVDVAAGERIAVRDKNLTIWIK
jgi:uncharacterized protein (TIGR03437 family)